MKRSKRYVKSFKALSDELQTTVYHAADRRGAIIAEEYGRAAFRFFTAALPVATGLLQLSARAELIGVGGGEVGRTVKTSLGTDTAILGWEGEHWTTRVAYAEERNPAAVKVNLVVRDAFLRKTDGLAKTGGKFGLRFSAGRSTHAEPETVTFLQWVNARRRIDGLPPIDTTPKDVAVLHAELILRRNQKMRGYLDMFIRTAKNNIKKRIGRMK